MIRLRSFRPVQPSLLSRHVYVGRPLSILSPTKRASQERIAVLHQAVDPPVVNGIRKPKKPGGRSFPHSHDLDVLQLLIKLQPRRLPRLRSRHLLCPAAKRTCHRHAVRRALPAGRRRLVLPRHRTRHPLRCAKRRHASLGQHHPLRLSPLASRIFARQARQEDQTHWSATSPSRRVRRQEFRQCLTTKRSSILPSGLPGTKLCESQLCLWSSVSDSR